MVIPDWLEAVKTTMDESKEIDSLKEKYKNGLQPSSWLSSKWYLVLQR